MLSRRLLPSLPPVTNRTCTLYIIMIIITTHDVHGDYGEVSCEDTGNTYSSALTVHIVSAGVVISGCRHVGELLLGAREGVLLDSGLGEQPSSHHDPVLKFNGTSSAGNEDDNNINIYSD